MEHIGASRAPAQNPKPADVTRTAERAASRRRQRRERAHIDSRHRSSLSSRRAAQSRSMARPACVMSRSTQPHRPCLSVDGRKLAHCSRRIRFIRFDRRIPYLPTTPHCLATTRWQLARARTCGRAREAACATTPAAARLSSCFLDIPAGPWKSWCVRVRSGQWWRCAMTWPLVAGSNDPRR